MTDEPPATINTSSKISLGILGSILASAALGGAYLSSVKTSLDNVGDSVRVNTETLKEVKEAIQEDSMTIAVLKSEMRSLENRIRKLESQ